MTTTDTSGKVIRRTFHGGSEDVTFEDFAYDAIQDDQVAAEIALKMIEGDGFYAYTADAESMYFETFEIIDREGLLRDLARVTEDAPATDPRPDPRTHPEYWTE